MIGWSNQKKREHRSKNQEGKAHTGAVPSECSVVTHAEDPVVLQTERNPCYVACVRCMAVGDAHTQTWELWDIDWTLIQV